MARSLVAIVLAASLSAPVGRTVAESVQRLPLEDLVARVQDRYRTLEDHTARMHQVRVARPGAPPRAETAAWYVRPPSSLRIEYEDSGRLFVAAADAIYWYLPEDNQVQVLDEGALDPHYTPTLYLAGAGDLLEDFRVSGTRWQEPLAPGNVQVRLDPLQPDQAQFSHLVLEIDPGTALIARLVQFGLLGETTDFQFHDIQTDIDLDDELFEFEFPEGVQVEYLGR